MSDDLAPMASSSVLYHFMPQLDHLEDEDIGGDFWHSVITLPGNLEQGMLCLRLTAQCIKWGDGNTTALTPHGCQHLGGPDSCAMKSLQSQLQTLRGQEALGLLLDMAPARAVSPTGRSLASLILPPCSLSFEDSAA